MIGKLLAHRTIAAGLLSPLAAAMFGRWTYRILTAASAHRDSDFQVRLLITAGAMVLPFIITLAFALADRRRGSFGAAGKAGLIIAALSLLLIYVPLRGVVVRSRQVEHLASENIDAPEISVTDLQGSHHSLSEYRGKVVVLNVWATWCLPCRKEMPALDQLYRSRKQDGLVVLGFSKEEVTTQEAFALKFPVSYPLLTNNGKVPPLLQDISRYPATFLIDRQGRLRKAPSNDEPFSRLVSRVDELLRED